VSETHTFFDDEDFQDSLASLLCKDPLTLRECASLLTGDDFQPVRGMRNGRPRWIIAGRALEHFHKHHEPIGRLLIADLTDYAHQIGMGDAQFIELRDYAAKLAILRLTAPSAIVSKVVRFKRERLKATALTEMTTLQSTGMLTDEKWREISRKALAETNGNGKHAIDYLATMDNRIERRRQRSIVNRTPWTYIWPLDDMVTCIGRGELGLILAPFKRGKSLFLLWLGVALSLQRYNVLHITLEDPLEVVEDRLDAITTKVPIKALRDDPVSVAQRFKRHLAFVNAKFRIKDMCDTGATIQMIDEVLEEERDAGFIADALIIDYDKKITPVKRHDRSHEAYIEIYTDLKRLLARRNLIGWTAAQTQRDTEHLKIISGDRAGDAIAKLQEVTMAIGVGKGDWGPDGLYLHIAAHKNDRKLIGCNIVPDLERMLIYSHDLTQKAERENLGGT
jgi:hypothetical protein